MYVYIMCMYTYTHIYTQVAAGDTHSLALSVFGEIWSFGGSAFGQLGHGNIVDIRYIYTCKLHIHIYTYTCIYILGLEHIVDIYYSSLSRTRTCTRPRALRSARTCKRTCKCTRALRSVHKHKRRQTEIYTYMDLLQK